MHTQAEYCVKSILADFRISLKSVRASVCN